MANETRVRALAVGGLIEDNPLAIGAVLLTSAGLAALPAIGATEHAAIILDPDGDFGAPEIVWVTAHALAANTATIVRAREGTVARVHDRDVPWVHGPTVWDFPVAGFEGKWPSGAFISPEGAVTTLAMTANASYFTPIWVPEGRTTADIRIETTVAGVGGAPTIRFGIHLPDVNGRPGALVVDAGTVDASVAAGILIKTVAQPLSRGLYFFSLTAQGATGTQPTIRSVNDSPRFTTPSVATSLIVRPGYYQAGVAGALPDPAVPATNSLGCGVIVVKAA